MQSLLTRLSQIAAISLFAGHTLPGVNIGTMTFLSTDKRLETILATHKMSEETRSAPITTSPVEEAKDFDPLMLLPGESSEELESLTTIETSWESDAVAVQAKPKPETELSDVPSESP